MSQKQSFKLLSTCHLQGW